MNYNNITVILPTFNEEQNIEAMLKFLPKAFPGIKMLVVDDGSRDNTRQITLALSKKLPGVSLLDRKKRGLPKGLSYSVIDGIVACKTKFAIVMDADFQHPPEKIKQITQAFQKGAKLVVGTRAKIPEWALYRRVISKTMIYVGYAILLLHRKKICDDIFSGFFGVERQFFVDVYKKNKQRFVGSGYKVLFDLLKCIDSASIKIYEVPFTFHSRKEGKSKAGVKQFLALLKSFVT